MTLRLVLAPGAAEDLEDAADFYEMQESGLGIDFYERSTTAFRGS